MADIAARRWDLHPVIAANPRTYPALRDWIASVNPGSMRPQPGHAAPSAGPQPAGPYPQRPAGPYPQPRRRGSAWGLAAGGCLTALVLVVALFSCSGALLASDDPDPTGAGSDPSASRSPSAFQSSSPSAPAGPSRDPEVDEHMAIYESEREQYYELLAQVDGNPVASLVTRPELFEALEERAASADYPSAAASVARDARQYREDLQHVVAAAEDRRVNSSGTLSEDIVDSAGNGFIDIRWDAASACEDVDAPADQENWITLGCVLDEDVLTVHVLPDSEYFSERHLRMVLVHELAHVYQNADAARFEDGSSEYERLLDEGLFQGSFESMADCYSLAHHNEWTLELPEGGNGYEIGYGYVCDESEREAIRTWAADLNAPVP
ncbi:hypothetical protein [Ruania rhizosphaerae]|uniref:variant leucine-rich repeat-containing protein n=1 Tax=Ruania rhizosphaerae TaxID=1840413 RepID=UPI00135BBBB1|nr:hypothetical protein [Ruania rhizosphaerae]